MAEIEHFVNPNDKRHSRFDQVRDIALNLFGRELQNAGGQAAAIPVGQAVVSVRSKTDSVLSFLFFKYCLHLFLLLCQGLINNETLGYFMARTFLFLVRCGIKPHLIRFRQHLKNEMAHYAKDCWDCEINMSYVCFVFPSSLIMFFHLVLAGLD